MTTIAYDGTHIAVDSRCTRGNDSITSDTFDKRISKGGWQFCYAGGVSDAPPVIDAFLADRRHVPGKYNATVFGWKDGIVKRFGVAGEILWVEDAHIPDSSGSGWAHAITAMDCGKSAKEAVQMAAKRDTFTGGRIRVYKV